jgi:hypothetical protein
VMIEEIYYHFQGIKGGSVVCIIETMFLIVKSRTHFISHSMLKAI